MVATIQLPRLAVDLQKVAGRDFIAAAPECALYGDSRLAGTHSGVTAYSTTIENAVSPAGWVAYLSRGRLQFPSDLNFAVGGDTTEDMLGRLATVVASRARFVLILAGTNDRGSAALTADQSIANMTTIIETLERAGKIVILISEMPRGDAVNTSNRLSSPQLQYHARFRHWMTRIVPTLFINTYVVDTYDTMAVYNSTTGDAISGMMHDGLHPSTIGAYTSGAKVATLLNDILPEPQVLPNSLSEGYDATYNPEGWINTNPTMNGTSGTLGSGSTGSVADNWTGARNSAMAAGTIGPVMSKVARGNGEWQQAVFSGNTAANSGPQYALFENVLTNISEGDIVEAFGELEIDSGAVGLAGVYMSIRFEDGSSTYESKSLDKRDTNNPLPSDALSGVMRVLPTTCPPSATLARIRWCVDFRESFTGVNATVRFGRSGIRKII